MVLSRVLSPRSDSSTKPKGMFFASMVGVGTCCLDRHSVAWIKPGKSCGPVVCRQMMLFCDVCRRRYLLVSACSASGVMSLSERPCWERTSSIQFFCSVSNRYLVVG